MHSLVSVAINVKVSVHFSDSGIADNELIIGIAIWCLIGLLDPEADGSTGFIKVDSIVQNVQQNLVQSEFICNNVLVFDIDPSSL